MVYPTRRLPVLRGIPDKFTGYDQRVVSTVASAGHLGRHYVQKGERKIQDGLTVGLAPSPFMYLIHDHQTS